MWSSRSPTPTRRAPCPSLSSRTSQVVASLLPVLQNGEVLEIPRDMKAAHVSPEQRHNVIDFMSFGTRRVDSFEFFIIAKQRRLPTPCSAFCLDCSHRWPVVRRPTSVVARHPIGIAFAPRAHRRFSCRFGLFVALAGSFSLRFCFPRISIAQTGETLTTLGVAQVNMPDGARLACSIMWCTATLRLGPRCWYFFHPRDIG